MPGFELIGKEEFDQVQKKFLIKGILFRHGFDKLGMEFTKFGILKKLLPAIWGKKTL